MTSLYNSSHHQDVVQSCITTISFPETIDEVLDMVEKNQQSADWTADIDLLLDYKPNCDIRWSSPKWLTQNDILFFYYTKGSKQRIIKLLQEVIRDYGQESYLTQFLEYELDSAEFYSGTIFACAEVSGATEYSDSDLCHFNHKFFAPLGEADVFDNPLTYEEFTEYITISQGTITVVYGKQFEGLRSLLSSQNILPDFLKNAQLKDRYLRDVNKNNWFLISCHPSTRFIYEAQLRTYLVDYLLNEIKDKGTPLLEECECYRGGRRTGKVDYSIKLDGKWIPVEAKLSILAEKDILSQIAKYTRIDSFKPTMGQHRGKAFETPRLPICLVVDQSGVYIVSDNNFFECSPGKPIWKREQLNPSTALTIRNKIINNFL